MDDRARADVHAWHIILQGTEGSDTLMGSIGYMGFPFGDNSNEPP